MIEQKKPRRRKEFVNNDYLASLELLMVRVNCWVRIRVPTTMHQVVSNKIM
jgi:hypothetical protein